MLRDISNSEGDIRLTCACFLIDISVLSNCMIGYVYELGDLKIAKTRFCINATEVAFLMSYEKQFRGIL